MVQHATLLHGMCVHDADLRHHQGAACALAFAVKPIVNDCERRFDCTTSPDLGLSARSRPADLNPRFFGHVVVPLHRERCLPLDVLEAMRLGFAYLHCKLAKCCCIKDSVAESRAQCDWCCSSASQV
eukprot:355219-Chlamydomonas_euryale.AAC.3